MPINPSLVEISINPSLDYLFQYPVESVETRAGESGFSIRFAGGSAPGAGACIGVEDSTVPVPDLTGRSLITVVRSSTTIRMIFGQVVNGEIKEQVDVEVPNENYFIIDPRFDGEAFYPSRFVPEPSPADAVREQFAGRFADGPQAHLQGLGEADPAEDTPEA